MIEKQSQQNLLRFGGGSSQWSDSALVATWIAGQSKASRECGIGF